MDKKRDKYIELYKFIMGFLIVIFIAIATGVINNIKTDTVDIFTYFGGVLIYLITVIVFCLMFKIINLIEEIDK